jgi:hypothetical protein
MQRALPAEGLHSASACQDSPLLRCLREFDDYAFDTLVVMPCVLREQRSSERIPGCTNCAAGPGLNSGQTFRLGSILGRVGFQGGRPSFTGSSLKLRTRLRRVLGISAASEGF